MDDNIYPDGCPCKFCEAERSSKKGIKSAYDKASLLAAAAETVAVRGNNYGTPEDNFARVAGHWTLYLNQRVPSTDGSLRPGDVAIMMALMKIARLENDPKHADSWIDLAGYAACGAEIETQVLGLSISPGRKP